MLNRKLIINTLCEFGPILGFIVAFELRSFQAGIITMMFATVIALVVLRKTEGNIPFFALLSSLSVLFFGGLSLFIDIPSIFILRDTLFDAFFGIALLISVRAKKPLFKILFRNVFAITHNGWMILTRRWGIFFIILSGMNEWIRLTLSSEQWVTGKILMMVASVLFGTYQFVLTKKERRPDATSWGIVQ